MSPHPDLIAALQQAIDGPLRWLFDEEASNTTSPFKRTKAHHCCVAKGENERVRRNVLEALLVVAESLHAVPELSTLLTAPETPAPKENVEPTVNGRKRCPHVQPKTGFRCGLLEGHKQDGDEDHTVLVPSEYPWFRTPDPEPKETHRSACTHPEFDAWWQEFGIPLVGHLAPEHLAFGAWAAADHRAKSRAPLERPAETPSGDQ